MKKIRANSIRRFAFIMCVVILGVVSVYFILIKKMSKEEEQSLPTTEVGILTAKDLTVTYPGTPREVMKLYCRVSQCLYGESYSDSEYEQLANLIYDMYSTDLKQQNPNDSYLSKLKKEVDSYKTDKKTISTYTISSSSEVDYRKINNKDCALIEVQMLIRNSSSGYDKATEQFILVKESGQWRIMGFQPKASSKSEDGE